MFRFFKRKGWLIFLLAFLLLFPPALKSQAKLNNRVLITGLAIDKTEGGYMITAQVIMPNPSSEASGQNAALDFVCEEGKSMVEGFKKVAYNIGEIAWHSHANFIILGEDLIKEDNVCLDLDYFVRDPHLPNSLMLLFCKGKAEEQIRKTAELKLSVGLGLQKIYLYKEESLSAKMMPMQRFVDYSYQPSQTGIISGLTITYDDECPGGGGQSSSEGGNSQSSGGAGGGSGASSASESGDAARKGRIELLEPIAYFKGGAFKGVLEEENEIMAYLLTQNKTDRFDITVSDVSDNGVYNNAKVGIRVASKQFSQSITFKDGKMVANFDITLDNLTLLEVLNEKESLNTALVNLGPYLNETLKDAIKKQLSRDVNIVFNKAKTQNVDIFNLANFAYKYNSKEFNEFLKAQKNIDYYLENTVLNVNINVKDFSK